jgi:hypothetical protein
MPVAAAAPAPRSALARIYAWRRVRTAAIAALVLSLPMMPGWEASYAVLWFRFLFVALLLLGVFGVLERWPRQLPAWSARWAVQVIGVAIAVPFSVALSYKLTTLGLETPWYKDQNRLGGFAGISILGLLAAPWIAMISVLRHVRDEAERQALAFELERSRYEADALDARLRLLQRQVEPHFLFNTLANVRELVDTNSPQAPAVLDSLIAYLRAAVPRLDSGEATLGEELDRVRAYLEVMQMRLPDRLQFSIEADASTARLRCPPTAVLTLVENAVRHGIDPCEDGGRIVVEARVHVGRCRVRVTDTGAGFGGSSASLGTGLRTLRERLRLAFGGDAALRLSPVEPRGACAEIDFPAREVPR